MDLESIRRQLRPQPFRPLDYGKAIPVEVFEQASLLYCDGVIQPVQIHMKNGQQALIFVKQGKRWARDVLVRIDPQGDGQMLGQGCFAGT